MKTDNHDDANFDIIGCAIDHHNHTTSANKVRIMTGSSFQLR